LGKNDWVLGDPHRIQQVLTNVITNAIKYTTSGQIVVSVKTTGDKNVIFECEDTGTGIPMNDQSKLFQRFVQRGGAPGTGLGLAISKHLVDLIGGRIYFESDPTIKPGTTCVVEMPLEQCNPPEPVVGQANKDEERLIDEAITLLIVDDVKMNRTMFRRRVKKGIAPNAKITEAKTGEEAIKICNEKQFDVIIMDQHMEEAGGVLLGTDTVVELRKRKIDSVIVGCSGNDIDEEFMIAGTNWVMKKPTPPNNVIAVKLRQLLLAQRRGKNLESKDDAIPLKTVDPSNSGGADEKILDSSIRPMNHPPTTNSVNLLIQKRMQLPDSETNDCPKAKKRKL